MSSELAEARERVLAAYSPELLKSAGHQLADLLGRHIAQAEDSAADVLNWHDPQANIQYAASILAQGGGDRSSGGESIDRFVERFAELVRTALDRGHNLHDPRYIGHQVPASVPLAGLFDAVGSVTNQVMAIYEMGPWATSVEHALVAEIGGRIGWRPGEFAGTVTHGGSLANLTALLTARNVVLQGVWNKGLGAEGPRPVLVAHAEAHYGVGRSAGILGLGTDQVVRVPLDERRRMDPGRLDDTLGDLRRDRRPVTAVVACACATPIGAFDPLGDVADVCERHGVWMHVDAAHGGAACLSRRHRHLVAGLNRADSLIIDAHKMMFVPALCAFVFYKDKKHRFEAFRQEAPYLFDPGAPGMAEFDSGLKTVECTKRAAAFGLWGLWSLFGPTLFEDMVDLTFDLGRQFYETLRDAPDFTPLHEPECNIVAFRHVPEALAEAAPERLGEFQLALRRAIVRSGEFYIVPTRIDGVGALRATVINPLTTADHFDALLDSLRAEGRAILNRSREGT